MSDWADIEAEKITGPCSCHEAYTSRGLIAPDCVFHLNAEDTAAALRKAKAEGMREAADVCASYPTRWDSENSAAAELRKFTSQELACDLRSRAARLEQPR